MLRKKMRTIIRNCCAISGVYANAIDRGIFVLDVMLIILMNLVIVLGVIIYYKQREKYYKKICTLKVEAHIVEREKISSRGAYGVHITFPDSLFRPVFAIDIEGTEYLIAEKKRVWTDRPLEVINGTEHSIAEREPTWIDRPLEEYPHLILWVNPQNTKQFRYDDERIEHMDIGNYIYLCICYMIIATIAFFVFR